MVPLGQGKPPVRRVTTALARRFHQICVAMVAESVARADLTPLQFAVLAYLNKQDGEPGVDQISLASRLGVDRNSASVLVDELAARGLLNRRVNGADRRARILSLTAKGEKFYERLRVDNVAANNRVLEPLSPRERKIFIDLLIRMISANSAYARPGAGRRKRGSRLSPFKRT
jgi:MarR family transcriptional regulator, lower aerobic nicotinate degradation pathway regulator